MISEKKTIHQRVKQNNCHCGFSQDNSFFLTEGSLRKKKSFWEGEFSSLFHLKSSLN